MDQAIDLKNKLVIYQDINHSTSDLNVIFHKKVLTIKNYPNVNVKRFHITLE